MGRLIPAGTGLEFYRNVELISEEPELALGDEAPPELELPDDLNGGDDQPGREELTT
jgi:hypothetical protein